MSQMIYFKLFTYYTNVKQNKQLESYHGIQYEN